MPIVLTTTDLGSDTVTFISGTRTQTYTHPGGEDLLVLVARRSTVVGRVVTGVTFNAVAMTAIVEQEGGATNPTTSCCAYRMDDPGALQADIVVTWDGSIVGSWMWAISVAGCPTTSPIDSFGSNSSASATSVIVTHTRVAADTMSIFLIVRSGNASAVWTANDGLVQILTQSVTANVSYQLSSLQESSSGSLARSATWTGATANKVCALCVSYSTGGAIDMGRRTHGGVPFVTIIPGVW